MNFDSYLDPPEQPEPPICPIRGCDGFGEYIKDEDKNMVFVCEECQHQWKEPIPDLDLGYDPEQERKDEEELIEMYKEMENQKESKCPHGLSYAECNACFIAGDLAYDAAREQRMFR